MDFPPHSKLPPHQPLLVVQVSDGFAVEKTNTERFVAPAHLRRARGGRRETLTKLIFFSILLAQSRAVLQLQVSWGPSPGASAHNFKGGLPLQSMPVTSWSPRQHSCSHNSKHMVTKPFPRSTLDLTSARSRHVGGTITYECLLFAM